LIKKSTCQQAFSLIELLLVLAIVGVMFLLVIPKVRGLFAQNRALAYAEELKAALRYARTSAILLGEDVSFCGSADHKECDGRWSAGQIVVTKSQQVLRVLPEIFRGDKLRWHGSSTAENEIVFLPTGFFVGRSGSFYYCPRNSSENGLRIILLPTGKVQISLRDENNLRRGCNS
jgi:prepilin-type N-terminal cleavage/methylation domain-containing protein